MKDLSIISAAKVASLFIKSVLLSHDDEVNMTSNKRPPFVASRIDFSDFA